jgi:hypothetical protein
MYIVSVVLLLLVLPAGSVVAEALWRNGFADVMPLVGKWFVFWPVGVRLFIAGVRQVLQPEFTAESIFDIKDPAALPIVREVGFANLAMGTLGLLTLAESDLLMPAAIVGALYYGLAGAGHVWRGHLKSAGWTALISDFFIFLVLVAVFVTGGF